MIRWLLSSTNFVPNWSLLIGLEELDNYSTNYWYNDMKSIKLNLTKPNQYNSEEHNSKIN